MKKTSPILLVIFLSLFLVNGIFTQNTTDFSFNQWHKVIIPETKAEVGLHKGKYFYRIPIQLKKDEKYTLLARWDDGKSRVIQITGYNPESSHPQKRMPETVSTLSINVGGNNIKETKVFKRNFTVSSDSESDIVYLTYFNHEPGQSVDIMIKSPAESDDKVLEVINGKKRGQVIKMPLFICQNRDNQQENTDFSFNQWHKVIIPETKAEVGLHKGKYFYRIPIQLKKDEKYTLLARWDDGKSRVIQITGYNPESSHPQKRMPETVSTLSINVGGNNIKETKVFKRNFTVSSDSESDIVYLTYLNHEPGQSVDIMIKSPPESDDKVLEVVKGKRHGQVIKMPLLLTK